MKKHHFQRYLAYLKPRYKRLVVILVFGFFLQTLSMTVPIYGKWIIDGWSTKTMFELLIPLSLMFAVPATIRWLNYYYNNLTDLLERLVIDDIRTTMVAKYLSLSLSQTQDENTGIKMSKLQEGRSSFSDSVSMIAEQLFQIVAIFIVSLVFLSFVYWPMAAVLLLAGIVYFWVSNVRTRPLLTLLKKNNKMWREVSRLENETLENAEIIRYFGREQDRQEQVKGRLEVFWESHFYQTWWPYLRFVTLRDVLFRLAVVGIYWWWIWEARRYHLTAGDFLLLFSWIGRFTDSLSDLVRFQRRWLQGWSKITDLFDVLATESKIKSGTRQLGHSGLRGEIEFKDVKYSYQDNGGKILFDNLSFNILPGKTTAIVGVSGAGKSTIVKLLMRWDDVQGGSILLDGIDLRELSFDYFTKIGIVTQQIQLFDDTLRYNLGLGHFYSEEDLLQVCQLCGISNFFDRLPNGLDTIIGENGIKLSGGERQRVSLGRAILADPEILILDEATSSLDVETERQIKESLARISTGRTTIIVAHRLSTIIHADQIIVLKNGKIECVGNHSYLLTNCLEYRRLIQQQVLGLVEAELLKLDDTQAKQILEALHLN
ncbi:MAG: ABC transporter ATP-binding protein [bacterium]